MKITSLALALILIPALAHAKKTATIVATTDFHGILEPLTTQSLNGVDFEIGGAAAFSAYIQKLREKVDKDLLIIDGGDLFQGSYVSNKNEGEPVIRFYNYLGVTAAALGNHEFDFGPVGERDTPRANSTDDAQGTIKQRQQEAKFPFLSVNVRRSEDESKTPDWLKRSHIVEVNSLRVGIIGASTEFTPKTTKKSNLKGLSFLPMLEPIKVEAERLRRENQVDVVVLATHAGGICDDDTDADLPAHPKDLSQCDKSGEIFQLIEELPDGLIDIVSAGHTHKLMTKMVKQTLVLQSGSHSKVVSWAQVTVEDGKRTLSFGGRTWTCLRRFELENGKETCNPGLIAKSIGKLKAAPATFLGDEIKADLRASALLIEDFAKAQAAQAAPIYDRTTKRPLRAIDPISAHFKEESAFGNLTADAFRAAVPGADIGMNNGGGLRMGLAAGPLNYGLIFNTLPFDNKLTAAEMLGSTLKKMVHLGQFGNQGGLSWSGLTFTANVKEILSISVYDEMKKGLSPLNELKTYKVVSNDYLFEEGGSGFQEYLKEFKSVEVLEGKGMVLRDAVVDYLSAQGKDISAEMFYDPKNPRQQIVK